MIITLYGIIGGTAGEVVPSFDQIELHNMPGVLIDRGQFVPNRLMKPVEIEVPDESSIDTDRRHLSWHKDGKLVQSTAQQVLSFAMTKVSGFRVVNEQ